MSENIGKIEYSPDYKSKAHKAPYKLEPQKVCPDDCGVIDGLDCRGPNCPLEQPQPTPDAILSDAIDEAASIIGTYTTGAKFGADVNWYDMKKAAKSVSAVILAAVREKVESVPTNYDSQVFGKGMGRDKTAKEFKQAILKLFREGE